VINIKVIKVINIKVIKVINIKYIKVINTKHLRVITMLLIEDFYNNLSHISVFTFVTTLLVVTCKLSLFKAGRK
jgi:hypothetical protein